MVARMQRLEGLMRRTLTFAKPLELRIQARNLLNQTHYASQDVRAVLAPGRSASLVATVKF